MFWCHGWKFTYFGDKMSIMCLTIVIMRKFPTVPCWISYSISKKNFGHWVGHSRMRPFEFSQL